MKERGCVVIDVGEDIIEVQGMGGSRNGGRGKLEAEIVNTVESERTDTY